MNKNNNSHCSRREFTAAAISAAAFTIVPRHVLGGPGFTPPSDKIRSETRAGNAKAGA